MITLAHISDIHLAPLPPVQPAELFSKRITGYVNWKLNRSKRMQSDTLANLVADMKARNPAFVAVTGDMVNLAAQTEIENAGQWLEELGPAERVCVIPGNHDAYVRGTLEQAQKRWSDYMRGEQLKGEDFPFLRRRGELAIIGCASGVPRLPFIASGSFKQDQADRLAKMLEETKAQGLFRIVLIHHPPVEEYAHSLTKGLRGAALFRDVIKQYGAELVLHGHLHHATVTSLDGPEDEVPVIGVAAASADARNGDQPARYNFFQIERLATKWSCTLTEYGYQRIGDDIVKRVQMRIY